MSRVSVLVVPLFAIVWAGHAPAQDKEKVLQTVQRLESRLEQIDRYFSGLQTSEAGAIQAEIVSMQKALAETRDRYAEQVNALAQQLEESRTRTRAVEHDLQGLRAQVEEAVDTVAAAEERARTAQDKAARLTAELADAILEGQANQREREALVQRAEDAGASLAAEQDRVAELEYQLEDLRAQLVEPPEASPIPTVLQVPTSEGIQIHVHGGEATFHIHGSGLPVIQPPPPHTDPVTDPDLRLRLRVDGASDRSPTVTPRTLPPRIHLP